MIEEKKFPGSINEYIASFPQDVKEKLEQIRLLIRQSAPDAVETIKYGIPTFTLKGNLISFAAYKKHIGLYPIPAGDEDFQKEIAVYRASKGTVRLPYDQPIPFDLISRMVTFRLKEHLERPAAKRYKK